MASSHWVATLLQTWFVFFPIYPDRAGAGSTKSELPVDCWKIQQMDEDLFVDAAWSLFVEDECCDSVFLKISLV